MNKIRPVTIKVHPLFFEGWFEPTRRRMEKMNGHLISQTKFTEIMAKKWRAKPEKIFFPKQFKKLRGVKFIL